MLGASVLSSTLQLELRFSVSFKVGLCWSSASCAQSIFNCLICRRDYDRLRDYDDRRRDYDDRRWANPGVIRACFVVCSNSILMALGTQLQAC